MGILDDIKREAEGKRIKIQTPEEEKLEKTLNDLFYLDKDIKKETQFIKHVMTRGQETGERKGLHASAIIETDNKFCYRRQVLSLFYKQLQGEQIKPSLKRIFSEGDAIHEKWQRLFIRGGYCEPLDCDYSLFNSQYDISYTPDIICSIGGIDYVVEIKSMNTYAYQGMVKKNTPHPSGEKQLQLYMYLTDVEHGFTLCEDKNTQEFKVRLCKRDLAIINPYIARLEQIQYYKHRMLDKHKLVKRHGNCINYNCKMASECAMRDVCYNKTKQLLN